MQAFSLQREFRRLKRAFRCFGLRFPADVRVQWSWEVDEDGNLGEWSELERVIRINSALRRWPVVVSLVLIHEMCHAYCDTYFPERSAHGKRWRTLMRVLAVRGVFDRLW